MNRDDDEQARAIAEAVEAERRALAQKLHDTISQTLSALVLQVRVGERRALRTTPEAASDWQVLGKSVQHAVDEMLEVMRSLRESGGPAGER